MTALLASADGFHVIDWVVLCAYLAVVVALGIVVSRRQHTSEDFFLAARSMPMWAVAVSFVATAQSAATFVGGPQQSYDGDLTYLASTIGSLLGAIIVAVLFVPAFYRRRVTSIYELLGMEIGSSAQHWAAAMFLIGRIFASGARLFIVALPFALIVFGDVSPPSMIISILTIATAAAAYTMLGGIRAVIWTDVLQAAVYITAVGAAMWLLLSKLQVGPLELVEAIRASPDAAKLTIIDARLGSPEDLARPYTIWAVVIGITLFSTAAYGADQDLSQRLLTCRSKRSGAWSVILAQVLSWPVLLLFLFVGLLLFVYYRRPELIGIEPPAYVIDDSRQVFLTFILTEIPPGLRGLMIAGLFAAAMSSMDSALNAMASSSIADFYRPWRIKREGKTMMGRRRELTASRAAVGIWAIALALFACICVYWQQASQQTLIDFALGVMVFAYSGLLAVFLTALLTDRGSGNSAVAALLTGFAATVAMEPLAWDRWTPAVGLDLTLAFPWRMLVATTLSFVVCCLGARRTVSSEVGS